MQSVTTCDNFQNIYFREYLLVTAFIRFRSTSFSEHLKVAAAFFIKQPSNFFLKKFLFKESSKRARSFILTSMMKENSSIVFHHVFFLYWWNLKILISLTLSHGEESYLPPPFILANIQPIHLKIDLEAIHDYEITFLPWRHRLFSCYPQKIAIFSVFILYQ